MVLREYYLGSVGPLLYEEDDFPEGIKVPKLNLTAPPTEDYHAARLEDVNSTFTGLQLQINAIKDLISEIEEDLGEKQDLIDKNQSSGYAGLDTVGRVIKGIDTPDDVIVSVHGKGIVLVDEQVTPHYWRLGITGGLLTLTDLGTTKP